MIMINDVTIIHIPKTTTIQLYVAYMRVVTRVSVEIINNQMAILVKIILSNLPELT